MSRMKHLTYNEALAMTRGELLERVDTEQQWWFRQMDSGRIGWSDEGYKEFRRIMHLLDPGEALADTRRLLEGMPGPSYWDQRPTPPAEERP